MKQNFIKSIFIAAFIFLSVSAAGQNNQFLKEMKNILMIHDTTLRVTHEIDVISKLNDLSNKYPSEWIIPYWASYLCINIGRFEGRSADFPKDKTAIDFFQKAQNYLDKCRQIKITLNNNEKADFHTLQGFIYHWFMSKSKNSSDSSRYLALRDREWNDAVAADPNNINLIVIDATMLYRNNTSAAKRELLLTALTALNFAEEKIKAEKSGKLVTSFWSWDLVSPFQSQIIQKLKNLTVK
jgi:hypothetical protein